MLCTSFRAPVERALRTRDIVCMSVCQGHQAVGTSQWSVWNVLIQFSQTLLQNHLESLLKYRLLCPTPRVYVSVSLGWAGEFTFLTSSRNYEGCWFGEHSENHSSGLSCLSHSKELMIFKNTADWISLRCYMFTVHHSLMWWHGFVPRHLGLLLGMGTSPLRSFLLQTRRGEGCGLLCSTLSLSTQDGIEPLKFNRWLDDMDGWMTQWTRVWANSGRQWRTGKPGMLQFMGLQRVGHNLVTEQQYFKSQSQVLLPVGGCLNLLVWLGPRMLC